jgi:hypothetical protein
MVVKWEFLCLTLYYYAREDKEPTTGACPSRRKASNFNRFSHTDEKFGDSKITILEVRFKSKVSEIAKGETRNKKLES